MRANRYTALIDACVLGGALTRNLVLSLAEAGFFRPRWFGEILAETERAISRMLSAKKHADADKAAKRHRAEIENAFTEAMVEGHAPLISALALPDMNDRHVLAAAIQTRAAVIVTDNLKHFPQSYLAEFELKASSTDDFLADVIDLYAPSAVAAIRVMRQRFKKPELDPEALLRRMEGVGLTQTVNLLIGEIESL